MADSPISNPPTVSMATIVRAAEHRVCTSSTESPAPSTVRPSDCRFPLAEDDECLRSHRRLDLHNRYTRFALLSCPVPTHKVSSRPVAAAGGAPFPGSLRDMTESKDSMTQAAQSRVFVDGNNVMGSRPDGWWRDRAEAARRLVAEIIPLTLGHGGVWTIVFDGKEPPAMPLPPERLTVIHTGHGRRNGADDRIVVLVDALPDSAASLVYTSDAKLRTRVEVLGAQVVGSGTLLRQIATASGTMEPNDTGHSPDPADGAGSDHLVNGELSTTSTADARDLDSL